jgi:tetratricopeptide (TPR) repeat protein
VAGTAAKVIGVLILVGLVSLAGFAGVIGWAYLNSPMRFAGVERTATSPPPPHEPPEDEGTPSRVELIRMLRTREFATLTATIDHKHAAVIRDIRNETELHRVVESFAVDDPAITSLFDEWIAASSASTSPLVAKAVHLNARAFAARGGRYAADTTPEQFAGMNEFLAKSVDTALTVVNRDPQHTQAHRALIDAARAHGDQAMCGDHARRGLTAVPASLRIRWALAMCRLPRWGGSYAALEDIWEQARPFVVDNPELKLLGGVVSWDVGRLADGDEAILHFGKAIAAGAHAVYFLDRAREYLRIKNAAAALDDATNALAMLPGDPGILEVQMRAFDQLGRTRETAAALAIIEEIDATNAIIPEWREHLARVAEYEARVAQQNVARQTYADGYQLYKAGDRDGALRAFRAHLIDNPSDFNAHRAIDIILAERRDWDGVIALWSSYLDRHPKDGRAFLERAGARRHKEGMGAARGDILSACALGNAEACDIARTQRWQ